MNKKVFSKMENINALNDHQQDLQLPTQMYELINLLQGQPLQQKHIAAPWLQVKPENSKKLNMII